MPIFGRIVTGVTSLNGGGVAKPGFQMNAVVHELTTPAHLTTPVKDAETHIDNLKVLDHNQATNAFDIAALTSEGYLIMFNFIPTTGGKFPYLKQDF